MAADDMHNDPNQTSSDVPSDQTAAPQLGERSSVWPNAIAVVSLGYAGLGIVFNGKALLAITQLPPLVIASVLLSVSLSVILFICGIGLLKRQACAPKWCRRWGIVYIVYMVIIYALRFYGRSKHIDIGIKPIAIELVIPLLWACAFPIFLLIWFARKTIKEEVNQWGNAGTCDAAAPPV